jgi:hypothetical protein
VVIAASSGDLLAVADQTNKKLFLLNPGNGSLVGSAALAHPTVAMAISPDGRWAYVVEQEAGASYVEPVDIGSLQLGKPVMPAAVLPVGANSRVPVLNSSGTTLFVPYTGNLANANDGGVAVISVSESACCDLVWKSLDGCPACDTADCLILATIAGYVAGDSLQAFPADPNDTKNNIARIDNHTRKLLPSTSTLAEIVECLCQSGSGGKGLQGEPGKQGDPGLAGPGIDKVAAQFVACDQPGSAAIAMVGTDRTLELVIPGACNHDFAHINAISWAHDGTVTLPELSERGLVIAFDREISATDVTKPGVVQILGASAARTLTCWCELQHKLLRAVHVKFTAVNPNGTATIDMTSITNPTAANPPNAIQLVPVPPAGAAQQAGILRVVVNGDFISSKDSKGVIRGADIDHLPGWLPKRLTGDGIEGGVFVSWFRLEG